MSEQQGDLLKWAEDEAKKEAEKKRQEQLENERAEDEEERKKLYTFGPGEKAGKMPKIQTRAEYVEIQKAHKEAINEDIQRTIDKIKKILKKDTNDPPKPR